MKRLISYTMMALLATIAVSIAAPSKDEIMAKEESAWQAFKDKDAAAFQKVVDGDMVGVYADSIASMKQELTDMKKWEMKSFKITDFKSHSDEKDVIVTSYLVTLEGTYDGKDASGTYNAGSVWKMENGQWLAIFHTNVLQQGTASAAQKKE
jgi:hypothetical protein